MFNAIVTTKSKFLGLVESRKIIIPCKTFKEYQKVSETLLKDKHIKGVELQITK